MSAGRVTAMVLVNLRLCLVEIFSNRVRSFISSLGIFLGTASLLVNMAFMRAMQDNIAKNMDQMGGASIITVRTREAEDEQEELAFHRSEGLRLSEVEAIAARLEGVETVIRQRDLGWQRLRGEGERSHGHVVAIDPDHYGLFNYEIDKGRPFTREEFKGRARVCIIGPDIGERLFENATDYVGHTVVVERTPCEVVGVLKTGSRWDRRSRECHVPYELYRRIVGV